MAARRKITFATVRQLAHTLPGVENGVSYRMPSILVKGKFLTCLVPDDSIAIKVGSVLERDYLLEHSPKVFFITPHYKDHPALRVRLGAVSERVLRELLTDAWRRVAPKKLVKEFDAAT